MKRYLSWILIAALSLLLALPVQAAPVDSGILVDGTALTFDVQPTVVDGVLMVPIRVVAEAMKGNVSWDEASQSATITSGQRKVVFTIGKSTALLDGREVTLSGKVVLTNDRTLVPASFLMVFYGEHLAVNNPAVRDAKAMELLLKSSQAPQSNMDLAMKQQIHMSDGVTNIDLNTQAEGKLRGQDLLLLQKVESLMIPPGAADTVVALKGGKMAMKVAGAWQESPMPFDIAEVTKQFELAGGADTLEMLNKIVLEAHLGESRVVNGATQQDLIVTYDMNRVFGMVGDLLPKEAMSGAEISFERFTTVITIDTTTNFPVAQKADAALMVTAEGKSMRVEIQSEVNSTPNEAPIVWPEDLKL